jgi:CIC family chloride channel protein
MKPLAVPRRLSGKYFAAIKEFYQVSDNRHQIRFIILALAIGVLAALAAIVFREGIDWTAQWIFGIRQIPFWEGLDQVPLWKLFLIPMTFNALGFWLTKRFAPEAQGHGVPEVMEAVATKRGEIRPRVSIVKMLASVLSISSGASVGREGPTALIGASVGSYFGQILKFPFAKMKMVVGCGTAAGIAATFNAPIAGVAFALELVVGSFNVKYLTPIVFSSMIATVLSHYYLGNFHELFSTIRFHSQHPYEILLYVGLGIVAGLAGALFCKTLYWCEDRAHGIQIHPALMGAIGGLGVGFTLLLFPYVTGPATWDAMALPISSDITWRLCGFLLLVAFIKILATSWALSTGGSGGVFAPSLMIGGALGGAYGFLARMAFPQYTDAPSGYALVGMGALVACVTQAPLTAITIVFELTHNLSIVLPLIVASGVGIGVYNHLMPGSIYTIKLQRRGINLQWGTDAGVLENVKVRKIYEAETELVYLDTPLKEVIQIFLHGSRSTIPVVDRNLVLEGIISFWDLKSIARQSEEWVGKKASDFCKKNVKFTVPDENLYEAFGKISGGDYEYLPVLSNASDRRLIGRLMRHQLLEYYKNRLTVRGIIR